MIAKWGPIYWSYLHMITLQYPENPSRQDKNTYLNLINNFISTLPCPLCREDIKKYITERELLYNLQNKELFVKYIWNVHNKVNEKLQKPILNFKDFIGIYQLNDFSNLFKAVKYNKIKNIFIIILLLVILFLVYKIYSK